MTTYIICYDISDDERRADIAKTLEGYGERRQYSVFECHLRQSQFLKLWQKLEKIMHELEDRILY